MHRKIAQNRKFAAAVENLTYLHFQSVGIACWGLFFEIRLNFGFFFEIFDFARLTVEINRLTRGNRFGARNGNFLYYIFNNLRNIVNSIFLIFSSIFIYHFHYFFLLLLLLLFYFVTIPVK